MLSEHNSVLLDAYELSWPPNLAMGRPLICTPFIPIAFGPTVYQKNNGGRECFSMNSRVGVQYEVFLSL